MLIHIQTGRLKYGDAGSMRGIEVLFLPHSVT